MLIISKRDTLYLHSCSDLKIQGTSALNQKHLVRVINLVRITGDKLKSTSAKRCSSYLSLRYRKQSINDDITGHVSG